MKFRKKPVVIEATQWFKNGDHPDDNVMRPFEDTGKLPTEPREGEVVRYFRHPRIPGTDYCAYCKRMFNDHGFIDTLEGGHQVCPGDWIITGVKGERYPCKPDIFAATYKPEDIPGQILLTETPEFAPESLTMEGLQKLTDAINAAIAHLDTARLTELSLRTAAPTAAEGTVAYWRLHFQA